ncbi:HNH endonuclease signature motif containing protein [uncultured Ornithinimicrobium sp.]|uniref:HNH endonuclease n=1 Tax=uncultured Ornithinimicrobium sp. TaxID=259307 RepID=UPI00259ADB43|nr:HNH endonuclease signature motif containing protein [uncultured Ornithinimicrobium sp.]
MSVGDDEVTVPDGAVRESGDGEGSDAAGPGPTREGHLTPDDLDALGDEIAQLAGQIAAATARFLALLGRFDEQGGWAGPGIRSLAHWLSWRAGMSLRTARDHVRVARSLRSLPQTAQAFGKGELSYSKVRAISRVATQETEPELVALARNAPAAHVERITAGLRTVAAEEERRQERSSRPDPEPGQPPRPSDPPPQSLQWRWDEDSGDLVVWGRFGPADGRRLLAALTRSELERIRTVVHEPGEVPDPEVDPDAGAAPHPGEPRGESVDRTAPPPGQAGPALLALAEIGLSAQEAPMLASSAEVVFVHRQDPVGGEGCSAEQQPWVVAPDDGPALDDGTAEEVLCGADSRCVLRDAEGAVLAFGRRRRRFSTAQLKALRLRDGGCRTPGCGRTRFLHAHHVVFWSRGGATDLDNAVLLCGACHRAVHLGQLVVRALGRQRFEFRDAGGEVLAPAPPMFGRADAILADRIITPRTVTGGWGGEPLDNSLVTSMLIAQWRVSGRRFGPFDPTPPWTDLDAPSWEGRSAA